VTTRNEQAGVEALARACKEDNQLWTSGQNGVRKHRRARDRAVSEAVDAGLSLEFIADKLGVLISDVERMAAAADER
jgi:hypothetical protein